MDLRLLPAALLCALALAVTGCGDDAAESPPAEASDSAQATPQDATSEEAADAEPADGEQEGPRPPIQPATLEQAEAVVEVEAFDGGTLVSALECGDAQVLTVGVAGFPAGVYEGAIEPSVGGDITLQVGEDLGIGIGARQGSFDAASYTVTFPDVEFTIDGCG